MRTNDRISIDQKDTKRFFSDRAKKYSENNPYAVTLYQDNNPDLVEQRNNAEINKLMPKLRLSSNSTVLDIGCGIGRWADAIKKTDSGISEYYGVDFSEDLISIANDRNDSLAYHYLVGGITDIKKLFPKKRFNRVLMMGVEMYLNDDVLVDGLEQITDICADKAVIVFREPIGIEKRLSLKKYYSDDLKTDYNAIYRTKDELMGFYEETLIRAGFSIVEFGPMYEEKLNNRKETVQWFFSFSR